MDDPCQGQNEDGRHLTAKFYWPKNQAANQAIGRFDGKIFRFHSATNEACCLFALSINEHANEADGAILLRPLPAIHQFLLPSHLTRFPPMEIAQTNSGQRLERKSKELLTSNSLGST